LNYIDLFIFVIDTTATLTPRPTTTTAAGSVVTSSPCLYGGVLFNGICNCPSGYGGAFCETLYGKYFCSNNYEMIHFFRLFFVKYLIYVSELSVKTVELVVFEVIVVFVPVELVLLEIIVN
jgi:hypothetical protein